MLYGFSIFHCLPVAMCGDSPAGTGTVMRSGTFRDYARRARFSRIDILPIEDIFFRFYCLRP